ncbi:unnamed protein product [Pleuronectes platessa]|uniref:Uncharacterized protein n=1 Tax=Pleuronectes platessa TaxID=8262 RepID=A0A9N7UC00_PLEPL|nr:unnamed protein product [Pleuronectes platessa]
MNQRDQESLLYPDEEHEEEESAESKLEESAEESVQNAAEENENEAEQRAQSAMSVKSNVSAKSKTSGTSEAPPKDDGEHLEEEEEAEEDVGDEERVPSVMSAKSNTSARSTRSKASEPKDEETSEHSEIEAQQNAEEEQINKADEEEEAADTVERAPTSGESKDCEDMSEVNTEDVDEPPSHMLRQGPRNLEVLQQLLKTVARSLKKLRRQKRERQAQCQSGQHSHAFLQDQVVQNVLLEIQLMKKRKLKNEQQAACQPNPTGHMFLKGPAKSVDISKKDDHHSVDDEFNRTSSSGVDVNSGSTGSGKSSDGANARKVQEVCEGEADTCPQSTPEGDVEEMYEEKQRKKIQNQMRQLEIMIVQENYLKHHPPQARVRAMIAVAKKFQRKLKLIVERTPVLGVLPSRKEKSQPRRFLKTLILFGF